VWLGRGTGNLSLPWLSSPPAVLRGWRRLSSWDYGCDITWSDGSQEEKLVNVDGSRVVDSTL
jgi:hypothetical protein